MADYLGSLERLVGRPEMVLLPGHGGRVEEPQRLVRAYLLHRRWREQAILAAIKDAPASDRATIRTVLHHKVGRLGNGPRPADIAGHHHWARRVSSGVQRTGPRVPIPDASAVDRADVLPR